MDEATLAAFTEELEKIGGLGAKWEQFKDLFRPEARRAKKDVALHFKSEHPGKWDDFIENAAASPQFVKQLARSDRADDKLVLHATSMAQLTNSNVIGQVESQKDSGQQYQIKELPGGRFGCTCNDWRFKGSVNPEYECKHIRAFKEGKMKVASFRDKTVAFFDELSKIRKLDKIDAEASRNREHYGDGDRPYSNLLTQDDEPSYYNPHPVTPMEDPEIILGGNG